MTIFRYEGEVLSAKNGQSVSRIYKLYGFKAQTHIYADGLKTRISLRKLTQWIIIFDQISDLN